MRFCLSEQGTTGENSAIARQLRVTSLQQSRPQQRVLSFRSPGGNRSHQGKVSEQNAREFRGTHRPQYGELVNETNVNSITRVLEKTRQTVETSSSLARERLPTKLSKHERGTVRAHDASIIYPGGQQAGKNATDSSSTDKYKHIRADCIATVAKQRNSGWCGAYRTWSG